MSEDQKYLRLVEAIAAQEILISQMQLDQMTLQAIVGLLLRHLPQETTNNALFEAQALAEMLPNQDAGESLKRVLPLIQQLASVRQDFDDTAH